MQKNDFDAVFVSSLPNIIYLTNFSGFTNEDRDGFALITKTNQYIFTHAIYKDAVKKYVGKFTLIEMTRNDPISKSIAVLVKKHKIKKIGYESNNLTVWEFERIFKKIDKKLLSHTDLLDQIREIKSNDETSNIKKACSLGDKAYSHILKNLRTGMTEKDLAFELEYFIRKNGGDISFPTIVAFDENAAFIHHQTGNKKLKKNTLILIDFGVKLNNYCSDMSRTFFFGKASINQKKAYQKVLTAQLKAVEYIKEKLRSKSKPIATKVDSTARDFLEGEGYPPFNHSSHGIGLQVHENPHISASKDPLENGFVFTIEPGIYLVDDFGIRIEDVFAIENNELIQLTHSSKNLNEI